MGKHISIESGATFGNWTVLGLSHRDPKYGRSYYLCRCKCGEERAVNLGDLNRGTHKSCGCHRRERMAALNATSAGAPAKNLAGSKFGRLTVTGWERARAGLYLWACSCDCGRRCKVRTAALKNGNTRSCGCLSADTTAARATTHGHAKRGRKTRTYRIWMGMVNRCGNPNNSGYRYYGALGVVVCERWKSYENFLADMGEIPAPLSIDRIDPFGNYEPGNCRLATYSEQARNKRRNHGAHEREMIDQYPSMSPT